VTQHHFTAEELSEMGPRNIMED